MKKYFLLLSFMNFLNAAEINVSSMQDDREQQISNLLLLSNNQMEEAVNGIEEQRKKRLLMKLSGIKSSNQNRISFLNVTLPAPVPAQACDLAYYQHKQKEFDEGVDRRFEAHINKFFKENKVENTSENIDFISTLFRKLIQKEINQEFFQKEVKNKFGLNICSLQFEADKFSNPELAKLRELIMSEYYHNQDKMNKRNNYLAEIETLSQSMEKIKKLETLLRSKQQN